MATTATAKPEDPIIEVWKAYKASNSDQDLRNQLIERYFPLVKYNGERIWQRLPDGVELDDLISAGVFGLMDAIDAYDMSRGVKFENLLRSSYSRCDAGRIANNGLGTSPCSFQSQ